MRIILFTFIYFLSFNLWANDWDPNNYFSDRSWTVDGGKQGSLIIKNKYYGEPVNLPNFLSIQLQCPQSSKKVWVTQKLRYCGIDAVSFFGNKVLLMLTDFDSSDSRGYCRVKRKKYLPLPSCQ